MTLEELVLYLTEKNNMMINFHDTSGIHTIEQLKLSIDFKIHSKTFCDIAKSTSQGYKLCTTCKSLACKKAINEQKYYYGYCPYGLFELVYPIIFHGKLVTIMFIGNFVSDKKITECKLNRACSITGIDSLLLSTELKNTETADYFYMLQTARLTENYITSILKDERIPSKNLSGQHWAISEIQLYINTHFRQKITLKELAKLYFLNEKYAGRLFLKQTGCTFHSYLSNIRLNAAKKLLVTTNKSVLDIAMESGFNSISYFNRIFLDKYGKTPTTYRKEFMNKQKP